MEYIFMIIFGICIIVLGVLNYKGNISSIHWYNRQELQKKILRNMEKQWGLEQ